MSSIVRFEFEKFEPVANVSAFAFMKYVMMRYPECNLKWRPTARDLGASAFDRANPRAAMPWHVEETDAVISFYFIDYDEPVYDRKNVMKLALDELISYAVDDDVVDEMVEVGVRALFLGCGGTELTGTWTPFLIIAAPPKRPTST